MNTFGTRFRITTWGESHGKAIGVVVDGCPAGLEISEEEINAALAARAPGRSPHTSPRKEPDQAEILSGLFEGKTTGTPISILIPNKDAKPEAYAPLKDVLRPGHANFTYLAKYGIFDHRGGGRASARETACRVAAGAIAQKLLAREGITVETTIDEIGGETDPDKFEATIEAAMEAGDSVGGVISVAVHNLPAGLGEPLYDKMEARLASAMLSINAAKGFEMGSGFAGARMRGSAHNDPFYIEEGRVRTRTNHAGGTLAGISTGMPLTFRVAFKPPASTAQPQETVTLSGEPTTCTLPPGSRHDPCVLFRARPVLLSMVFLVLADFSV